MSDAERAPDRAGHAPGGEGAPIVAVGIGGRIELTPGEVRLVKGGVFGHAVELLWLGHGVIEKTIRVRDIAAVEIVKSMLLPDFIRFSYPGSPPETGHYIGDALAENALIMSWIDNRAFYRIKSWLDRWPQSAEAAHHSARDGRREFP